MSISSNFVTKKRLFQILSWAALTGAIICATLQLGPDARYYSVGTIIFTIVSIVFTVAASRLDKR